MPKRPRKPADRVVSVDGRRSPSRRLTTSETMARMVASLRTDIKALGNGTGGLRAASRVVNLLAEDIDDVHDADDDGVDRQVFEPAGEPRAAALTEHDELAQPGAD